MSASPTQKRLLGLAATMAVCAAGVYLVAVRTTVGQVIENEALVVADDSLARGERAARALDGLTLVSSAAAAVAITGIALIRRRWHLALGVAVFMSASVMTSELLKRLVLSRPDLTPGTSPIPTNSFPSGHATVAAALALAFVLVVPTRWRAWATVAAAVIASVYASAVLAAGWHRASDAVGSVLLVVFFGSVASAALVSHSAGQPGQNPISLPLTVTAVGGALLVLAGAVILTAVTNQISGTSLDEEWAQWAYRGEVIITLGIAPLCFAALSGTLGSSDLDPVSTRRRPAR